MLQIYFYFDIFAAVLTKQFYIMKKLMSIFGIILFAFAITLTACNGEGGETNEHPAPAPADAEGGDAEGGDAEGGDAGSE